MVSFWLVKVRARVLGVSLAKFREKEKSDFQ